MPIAMMSAVALAVMIGVCLGLLGGGGSILMLPMLVYVLGMAPREAIAMSLFVVGTTSLVAMVFKLRKGQVQVRMGLTVGAFGMLGAWLGSRLGSFIPENLLLLGFALIMLITGASMVRGRKELEHLPDGLQPPGLLPLGGMGLVIGGISGLLGAGGGFLLVPALAIWGRLPFHQAASTSLFVIALQSLAGFSAQILHVTLDAKALALISGATLVGSLIGIQQSGRFQPNTLRKMFGVLVMAVGLGFLGVRLFVQITGEVPVQNHPSLTEP